MVTCSNLLSSLSFAWILVQKGAKAQRYRHCDDYICNGFRRSDYLYLWEECIEDNELYNPDKFETDSFCNYCLLQKNRTCYCATNSECHEWYFGFGSVMIFIGLICCIVMLRKGYVKLSNVENDDVTHKQLVMENLNWLQVLICLFCFGVIIGGIVMICIAAAATD